MRSCVLITIDCLRRDHVGCYGYHRNTTPNIDELAASGTRYQYSYANAPGTAWALQTLLTGVYTHQINGFGLLNPDDLLIPSRFNSNGYSTAGFANNGWLSRDYDYHRYFDRFRGVKDYTDDQKPIIRFGHAFDDKINSQYVRQNVFRPIYEYIQGFRGSLSRSYREGVVDADLCDDAIEWIETQQKRGNSFFAWIHLMNAHSPWSRWDSHLQAIRGDTDIDHIIDAKRYVSEGESPSDAVIDTYDAAIRSADEQVGRLKSVLNDDASVVITGDHGEEFGEYGNYHNLSLYSSMTRVPLIVKSPELPTGVVNEFPAQHVDVAPTLADLFDHEYHPDWSGGSLLSTNRSLDSPIRFAVDTTNPRRGVREGRFKYIESDRGVDTGLFADGHEQHDSIDVRDEYPAKFSEYRKRMAKFRDWMAENKITDENTTLKRSSDDLSSEVQSNLEDLGYLD
ncbi:sulfatase [Natrinema salaciae]|uniref:Arylsulfatase A n=1 Tax=Natrinema salaciae TaxID=1186196 RepID=A0A1H9BXB3_9EURY|nr:sulfatase [Natrinema salaciae]SEP93605.1 Arylsulfatase A [Natrinema salaciae]